MHCIDNIDENMYVCIMISSVVALHQKEGKRTKPMNIVYNDDKKLATDNIFA